MPKELQLMVGVPMFIALTLYALIAGESLYAKLIYVLAAISGFLYLLAISVKNEKINDVIVFIMIGVILSILVIPKIQEHRRGNKKASWSKMDIAAIIILLIMAVLFVLSKIF